MRCPHWPCAHAISPMQEGPVRRLESAAMPNPLRMPAERRPEVPPSQKGLEVCSRDRRLGTPRLAVSIAVDVAAVHAAGHAAIEHPLASARTCSAPSVLRCRPTSSTAKPHGRFCSKTQWTAVGLDDVLHTLRFKGPSKPSCTASRLGRRSTQRLSCAVRTTSRPRVMSGSAAPSRRLAGSMIVWSPSPSCFEAHR